MRPEAQCRRCLRPEAAVHRLVAPLRARVAPHTRACTPFCASHLSSLPLLLLSPAAAAAAAAAALPACSPGPHHATLAPRALPESSTADTNSLTQKRKRTHLWPLTLCRACPCRPCASLSPHRFSVRSQLANQLGIDARQVQIWFQVHGRSRTHTRSLVLSPEYFLSPALFFSPEAFFSCSSSHRSSRSSLRLRTGGSASVSRRASSTPPDRQGKRAHANGRQLDLYPTRTLAGRLRPLALPAAACTASLALPAAACTASHSPVTLSQVRSSHSTLVVAAGCRAPSLSPGEPA